MKAPLHDGFTLTVPLKQGRPDSGWTHQRSAALRIAALVLPAVALATQDRMFLPALLLVLLVCTFWHFLFARSRQQLPGLDLLGTALLFSVMLPPGYAMGQLLLAISFGVVLGEQVFGGRGYGFTHPAVVALAFLLYSFPEAGVPHDNLWLTLSLLPGFLLLLVYRLVDYRLIAAMLIGVAMALAIPGKTPALDWPAFVVVAGMLFAVTDPAVGSMTRLGNVIYGLVAGLLIATLDPTLTSIKAVVFASLLASISAPLIDWGVERFYRFNRSRSHV